ncbi:adenylate/guanylate cyclase domain-containing protein [Reyranella sp.]|uniref:adenylate/guanylate cyclase domain-containing protein n=1 Tax=Reyranella sp. TaxID=1929291 RepID=UPI003D09FFC3
MADELRRWLVELGLGIHAEAFAANGVDWDVLDALSEKDLETLGLSLGDRKRLLKAVAALGDGHPSARWASDDAERRQITVMFVDLVDSTPLSEQLDPEELRELLKSFHGLAVAAVAARGGHVARYMGDGILVYFGYPQAHEDDAARAVHAGLGILENLRAANPHHQEEHGVRLRVRIGIHTGLVVVGEVGAGAARDRSAVTGETPNIASRLQAEAEPDTVVIGEATKRLVEDRFTLQDLGPRRLKGVSNAVRLFRVLGGDESVDRFRHRTRRGMTPLVGRQAELDMLRRRWAQVRDGEMRSILLGGDAGIGKSRVMSALRDSLAGEPHRLLPLFCSPYHRTSAFWPMVDWFRRTLRLDARSRPLASGEALVRLIGPLGLDLAEAMPVLSAFLDLPRDERFALADTTAPNFRARLIDVLVKLIGGMAAQRPLLLVLEDAHWIDPSMLELLRQVQERLAATPLMLLMTARPEFKPDWSYSQFVQINLDRLSRRDRLTMVERLVGGRTLPADVLQAIVAKTDGIPLFVEELTKAVLDGESASSPHAMSIPDTLHGSLMARLDRLDAEAREVAQLGATIGREFSISVLARLAGRSEEALAAPLARLAEAEIVVPSAVASFTGPSYVFRHVLIQEVAYQSLLVARRRLYHAAIAEALATHFPELAMMQPETIAQHWTSAARAGEAIDWWRRAGDRAIGRSAFLEASAHFQRGFELAEKQAGGAADRYRSALPLLLARGDAEFMASTLPGRSTYLECARIAQREGLPDMMVSAALKFAAAEVYLSAPSAASVELLEQTLTMIGEEETLDRCRVLSQLGKALLSTGATARGREVLRLARPIAERLDDRRSRFELLVSDLMPNAGPPPSGDGVEERRRSLASIWDIARGFDSILQVEALTRSAAGFLEIGDVDGFERTTQLQKEIADTSRTDFDKWITVSSKVMRGLIQGNFREAERLALEALNVLGSHDVDFPLGVYGMQMFTVRREQGRLAEVAPLVKRFVRENPEEAVWRPGLMLIASDLGFEVQARRTFELLAESAFALPIDSKRAVTLSYLAEVCARLDDASRAEQLYAHLLPYRDLAIVVPTYTLCCGSAARYLGMLATTMADWPSAERHFEAALAMEERMRAWPWLAHTRAEYAAMLAARGDGSDDVRAAELREMALAAADRLEMGRLRKLLRTAA